MKLNPVCYGLLVLTLVASLLSSHPVWMGLLSVNVLTCLVYGADKLAARKGWQRVPEITLLVFGFVGGWVGGLIGQQLFRHKTQKQPFRSWFMLSAIMNIVVVLGAGSWINGYWVV